MMCVSAIALWTLPTYFEGVTMIAVLFVCKILYEGFYTMFNIPMGSMLSAMADTDGERAALSSARGFGSMIGNIIPMIIMPQLLAKLSALCSACCTMPGLKSAMSVLPPARAMTALS